MAASKHVLEVWSTSPQYVYININNYTCLRCIQTDTADNTVQSEIAVNRDTQLDLAMVDNTAQSDIAVNCNTQPNIDDNTVQSEIAVNRDT